MYYLPVFRVLYITRSTSLLSVSTSRQVQVVGLLDPLWANSGPQTSDLLNVKTTGFSLLPTESRSLPFKQKGDGKTRYIRELVNLPRTGVTHSYLEGMNQMTKFTVRELVVKCLYGSFLRNDRETHRVLDHLHCRF